MKTAFKYTFSKAKNQRRSTFVIIIGICISFIAFLILSSVMNGLQSAQLDKLKNLDSFDIIIEDSGIDIDDILSIKGVDYAYYFMDSNVLISNIKTGHSDTVRIRGINLESYISDRTKQDINYKRYLEDSNNLTISANLLSSTNSNINDTVQVTYLRKGKTTISPYNRNYKISGLYVCSLSDYALNNIYIDINEMINVFGKENLKIGIFCKENFDNVFSSLKILFPSARIISWKETNKTLYSALMLEKALMYLFLGFVFVIICVNLKNSTNRLIDNKIGEASILRACGLSKFNIYLIFIIQGLITTLIGTFCGLIIGYFLVINLNTILKYTDKIIDLFSSSSSYLSSLPLMASFNWLEALLVTLYIIILTIVFVLFGCKKLNRLQIVEVIGNASNKI